MESLKPEQKAKLKTFKSKLQSLSAEIKSIVEQGRSIKEDVDNLFLFKGMFKGLQNLVDEFNSVYDQVNEYCAEEGLEVFPSENDKKLASTVKRYYYESCAIYEDHMNPTPTNSDSNVSKTNLEETKIIQAKLPQIHISEFDGDPHKWCLFRDTFTSLIHDDSSLSNYAKFHYLVSSLRGSALTLIKGIKFRAENYDQAWDLLMSQYNDKRMLAWNYLKTILDFTPLSGTVTANNLKHFLSVVIESIASLKRLEIEDLEDFILFSLTLRCLDPATRKTFERQCSDKEIPKYDELVEFVKSEWRTLDLISESSCNKEFNNKNFHKASNFSKKFPNSFKSRTSLFVGNKNKPFMKSQFSSGKPLRQISGLSPDSAASPMICPVCKSSHLLYHCETFRKSSPCERWALLEKWDGCKNCLSNKHTLDKCPSTKTCQVCQKNHHTWLHTNEEVGAKALNTPGMNKESGPQGVVLGGIGNKGEVILGTAIIGIKDVSGQLHNIRIVTDCGSQYSFITERCARRLGLKCKSFSCPISGIGQTPLKGALGTAPCVISSQFNDEEFFTDAVVVPEITGSLPHSEINIDQRLMYSSFQLADPTYWRPGPVDFLLGGDLYFDIMTGPPITVKSHLPKLVPTLFGYIVAGKSSNTVKSQGYSFLVSSKHDMIQMMNKFWETEEVAKRPLMSKEEKEAEEHFEKTHYRLDTGRYVVSLPFKGSINSLQNTHDQALSRLYNLEYKLSRDTILRREYNHFMEEYIRLGHMRVVSSPSAYTIPHHAVFKRCGDINKLRVVFDASCRDRSGLSLNDCLLIGPKHQKDISVLLLKFRTHLIAFTTDIVKMFRQILIHPKDRKFLRILWRFDPSDVVKTYELCTVTYGTASAPFLALRVLIQLALDEGSQYPTALIVLLEDIYVDDVLSGAETLDEALKMQQEIIALLKRGGLELSKWASNRRELLEAVQSSDTQEPLSIGSSDSNIVNILGMQWLPSQDVFCYKIIAPNVPCTKRGILSAIARIYDPLGYLAPVVFYAKVILQEMWFADCDWDQEAPDFLKTKWITFSSQLESLSSITIERFISMSELAKCQLIGFCDASIKGYSACIYLKAVSSTHTTKIHLLKAKTKLAPKKTLTIPKLELSAALLLTKLYNSCKILLDVLPISTTIFFTDSSITLSWLSKPPGQLKAFESHRVVEILDSTQLNQWRHISSKENPADCASRGVLPIDLIDHSLWWTGPEWLTYSEDEWPKPVIDQLDLDRFTLTENEKGTTLLASKPNEFISIIERFSSYSKLISIISYAVRFLNILAKSFQGKLTLPTLHERRNANLKCIKIIQSYYFLNGKSSQEALAKNKALQPLNPFIDELGVVRVGGRLRHSSLPFYSKHPIILPGKCHFTRILLLHYHNSFLHIGPSALQSIIQTRYWITSARQVIRKLIRSCHKCARHNATTIPPQMGDLPASRLLEGHIFQNVGVDFGGPFSIRESLRRKAPLGKAYLCLFICFSTKALHLEVVSNCSTQAFLAALDRFVARRGKPLSMHSDCGTNFVGASKHLKEVHMWLRQAETQNKILQHTAQNDIDWKFNPPHAPHFGGIWEAAIKSAKLLLKRTYGDLKLTFEELATIFSKVEAILNSRPMYPMHSDPESIEALTPGHFLIGRPLVALPEESCLQENISPLKRWHIVQQCTQHFWNCWRLDYLNQLQQRSKWLRKGNNLKPGELVIIKESNAQPAHWPLGRIIAIHPGFDNIVRVATVKTPSGIFKRPIIKLIPLLPYEKCP